jgi:alpha-ribazole phosphatase
MKVYLIRHGKTYGNSMGRYIGSTDEPLLLEEKERLRKKVCPHVDTVFVSPMLRCRQTAELLFGSEPMRIMEELRECDFGAFENKNWKELTDDPRYQDWIASNGTLAFPEGENSLQFRERCCRGFAGALAECFRERIEAAAFVVHGGTIMSIMERYAIPAKDFYEWHVDNCEGYELEIEPSLWTFNRREIHRITPRNYE